MAHTERRRNATGLMGNYTRDMGERWHSPERRAAKRAANRKSRREWMSNAERRAYAARMAY